MQVWGNDGDSYHNITGKILWIRYGKICSWNQSIYLNNKGYIIIDGDEINEELKELQQWYVTSFSKNKQEKVENLSMPITVNWSNIPFISLSDAEKDLQKFELLQIKPSILMSKIKGVFIAFARPGRQQWYWGAKTLNYAGCVIHSNGEFWCKKGQCFLKAKDVEERWAMKIIITNKELKNKIAITLLGDIGNEFMGITARIAHQKYKAGS